MDLAAFTGMANFKEDDRAPILRSPKAPRLECQKCGYVADDVTNAREHRKGQSEHWFDFVLEGE